MSVVERASELLETGGLPARVRKGQLAEALGCHPSNVTKLLRRGAIPAEAVQGQMVDTRQALEGIVRATDPARAEAEPPVQQATLLPRGDSFAAIKSRKELALAQRNELELAARAGELVERAAVRAAIEDRVRAVTQDLMQIGARIGEQLAAESDPQRCRLIVQHEIRAALGNLTRAMSDYVGGLES